MRKFTKNCLATKQRKCCFCHTLWLVGWLVGILGVLVGVLGVFVGLLSVLVGLLGILVGVLDLLFGVLGFYLAYLVFLFGVFGVLAGVLAFYLAYLFLKKVHRLEKSTLPPVVAVVTNIRYDSVIVIKIPILPKILVHF